MPVNASERSLIRTEKEERREIVFVDVEILTTGRFRRVFIGTVLMINMYAYIDDICNYGKSQFPREAKMEHGAHLNLRYLCWFSQLWEIAILKRKQNRGVQVSE